jgi:hypothetical protein
VARPSRRFAQRRKGAKHTTGPGVRPGRGAARGARPSPEAALARLKRVKDRFSAYIATRYAWRAKDCSGCPTPCCADAEFVNVNITRLEGVAILRTLTQSPRVTPEHFERILARARAAVRDYGLDASRDTFATTYACPLFEPGRGCLVHYKAKPAPCIQHGCYDRWQDLPDELELARAERQIAHLNRELYGGDESAWGFRTIPAWLVALAGEAPAASDAPDEAASRAAVLVQITRRQHDLT